MFELLRNKASGARRGGRTEGGFSAVEVLIVVAVVVIIATFAVMTLARARDGVRLTSSARELASLIEKARLDSIRRHEVGGQALVTFTDPNTYSVFMDFNGTGAPITRTYTMQEGVFITNNPLPAAIGFNWRGRTTATTRLTLRNARGEEEFIDITIGGEVSVGRELVALAAPGVSPVGTDADVNSMLPAGATTAATTGGTMGTTGTSGGTSTTGDSTSTTGSGTSTTTGTTTGGTTTGTTSTTGGSTSTTGNTTSTTGGTTSTTSTTGTGTTTGGTTTGSTTGSTTGNTTGGSTTGSPAAACTITAPMSSMSIKKNNSTTITVTMTGSTSLVASSNNASVTVSLLSTSGNTYTYTIASINNNKNYVADITFVSGCDPTVKVKVSVSVTP